MNIIIIENIFFFLAESETTTPTTSPDHDLSGEETSSMKVVIRETSYLITVNMIVSLHRGERPMITVSQMITILQGKWTLNKPNFVCFD